MTKFNKFEEMYNKFKGMTEEERRNYQKQLCEKNYKIMDVYHMYFEDTKEYGNETLFVKNTPWCDSKYTGEKAFLDALDYFDVNDFVYAASSSNTMADLKFFCDNGWKVVGMAEETDWTVPIAVLSEDKTKVIYTDEVHKRAGVKLIRKI